MNKSTGFAVGESQRNTIPNTNLEVPNLAWVEKILPQLILISPSSPDLSDSDRRILQECIRKCEYLLTSRQQVEKLNGTIRHASSFSARDTARASMESFFAKQSFVGDRASRAGQVLFDLRIALAQKNFDSLPKDVLNWLIEWDKRIDAATCDARLGVIQNVRKSIEQSALRWRETAKTAVRGKMGLWARLRVLRFSRRVKKQQQSTKYLQAIVKKQAKICAQRHKHVERMCALLSIFFRMPVGAAGDFSQRVGQWVLFNLEKDLNQELEAQLGQARGRLTALYRELEARMQVPKDLRRRILELESQKNSSLVSLYAKRNVDLKQVMADAASLQVRVAFTEVESRMVNETKEVNDLQTYLLQMKQEIRRLSRIMDDHLNQVKPYDARKQFVPSETGRTSTYANSGSEPSRRVDTRFK